jgi:hypothetical protein
VRRVTVLLLAGSMLALAACSSGSGRVSAGASGRTTAPSAVAGQPNSTAPSDYRKPKVFPSLAVIRGQYLADVAGANAATDKLNVEMLTGLQSSCGCFNSSTNVNAMTAYFPPLLAPYQAELDRLDALSWELQGGQTQGNMSELLSALRGRIQIVKAITALGSSPAAATFEADIKSFQTYAGYAEEGAAAVRDDIGLPQQ